jgi:hypothetical protein
LSTFDEMLRAIPTLTASQRQRLKAAINACGSLEDPDVAGSNSDESFILAEICNVLAGKGVEYLYPAQLRRTSDIKNFREKLPGLFKYLSNAHLMKHEQRALLTIGLRLLYQNMRGMGVPVSGVTMMRHIHRIPACINHAYPTYAENHILRLIVSEEVERVRQKQGNEAGSNV